MKCYALFQDSWFASLYEKFRNERKGLTQDPEVIIRRKRKSDTSSKVSVCSKLRRGAINWEPPYPEGEDDVSLKRHIEFLQNESLKRKVDSNKIEKRMDLTFPSRRRFMNESKSIADIKSEYPILFDFDQVNYRIKISFEFII